ncbi:MAG: hypothetical protein KFW07_02145 [Mycoplasmataceae bacterium]|nr:hypothetical protein [Mycoplasmataceae bacterium]
MRNKFSFAKFKSHFQSEKEVNGRRRLYNSLWALFFGFLASVLIILMTGNNPFEVFSVMFNDASNQTIKFTTTIIVFIIATLGTAMCFKSGIFNIGVSGQMMAGGVTTVLIMKLIGINGGTIVLAIIISMLIGALVAFIAGILKAFLRVNEVVSTILINWTIFYVVKFIIKSDIKGLVSDTSISQNQTSPFVMPEFFQSNAWLWLLIIFGIMMILVMSFIFTKTTMGYKMNMLSLNKHASKYAGTNEKIMLITIMSVAGAFAGLAGFLYYSEIGVISAHDEPISMGFDTIAIALLVYNNPFGVGLASIMFSIIQLGCASLKPLFPPLTEDFAQIMFGIIIYIAAIGVVFEKFKIYIYLKNKYIYFQDPDYMSSLKTYRNNQIVIFKMKIKNFLSINNIKKENYKIWKKIKNESIKRKEKLDIELLSSNKKTLDLLSTKEQEYYFSKILLIKKEKDEELFQNKYFDILGMKNNIKSLNLKNKDMLKDLQEWIIQNNQNKAKKEKIDKIHEHSHKKEEPNGNI